MSSKRQQGTVNMISRHLKKWPHCLLPHNISHLRKRANVFIGAPSSATLKSKQFGSETHQPSTHLLHAHTQEITIKKSLLRPIINSLKVNSLKLLYQAYAPSSTPLSACDTPEVRRQPFSDTLSRAV